MGSSGADRWAQLLPSWKSAGVDLNVKDVDDAVGRRVRSHSSHIARDRCCVASSGTPVASGALEGSMAALRPPRRGPRDRCVNLFGVESTDWRPVRIVSGLRDGRPSFDEPCRADVAVEGECLGDAFASHDLETGRIDVRIHALVVANRRHPSGRCRPNPRGRPQDRRLRSAHRHRIRCRSRRATGLGRGRPTSRRTVHATSATSWRRCGRPRN